MESLTLENLQQVSKIWESVSPFDDDEHPVPNIHLTIEGNRHIFFPDVPGTSRWLVRNFIQAITGYIFEKEPGAWVRTDEKLPPVESSETLEPLTLDNLRLVQEFHVHSREENCLALFLQPERKGRLALNSLSTAIADNPERRLLYDTEFHWVWNLLRCVTGKDFKIKYAHDPYIPIWQVK